MRVSIVPEFPVALMTGGLQVQAEETLQALAKLNGELTPEMFTWSDRRPLPDLYHFVGLQPSLYPITELVREAGKPYVLTLIAGLPAGKQRPTWASRLRYLVKTHLLKETQRHQALQSASRVIVVNDSQAAFLGRIFGLNPKRQVIIPHGVQDHYFAPSPELWHARYGSRPFVLCVGAIQDRKGQLLLANVCNHLHLPLVLLGKVLPGQRDYGARVTEVMHTNQKFGGQWIQTLHNEDPMIASAYAACRLFALLSSCETQPISVLQAMASGKPVLLLAAPYTADKPFDLLPQASSTEISSLSRALQQQWELRRGTSLSHDFAWPSIARRLYAIYDEVRGEERI